MSDEVTITTREYPSDRDIVRSMMRLQTDLSIIDALLEAYPLSVELGRESTRIAAQLRKLEKGQVTP